jgi:hypothetical protein
LQFAQANASTQKLQKSMSLPSGLKKKYDRTTKCINHWADSANLKGVTFNKICSGLTGKCFEMPNASYTNRYGQV